MCHSLLHIFQLVALVLLPCVGPILRAQNTTAGAIVGTVMDSTGAALDGVQVMVTNQATHAAVILLEQESGRLPVTGRGCLR